MLNYTKSCFREMFPSFLVFERWKAQQGIFCVSFIDNTQFYSFFRVGLGVSILTCGSRKHVSPLSPIRSELCFESGWVESVVETDLVALFCCNIKCEPLRSLMVCGNCEHEARWATELCWQMVISNTKPNELWNFVGKKPHRLKLGT